MRFNAQFILRFGINLVEPEIAITMRKLIYTLLIITLLIINSTISKAKHTQKEQDKPFDILGIGLSEIDVLSFVDDEYIKRHLTIPYDIPKGKLSFTDEKTWNSLKNSLKEFTLLPSGEIASLLFVYSSLGGKSAFSTVLAHDEYGEHFLNNIKTLGISLTNTSPILAEKTVANLVYVTPDGATTHVSVNGNGTKISQKDIKYHQIKDFKMVITESSLWDGGAQSRAIMRAFNVAKKVSTKRVFLLSDSLFARQYKEDFIKLTERIDILIASQKSMFELLGVKDVQKMIEAVSKLKILVLVTNGSKGAIAIRGSEVYYIKPNAVESGKIIDKTGSQAAFAAGFLYNYIHGKSIEESGELAARAASYIIQQIGSNPKNNLSEILNGNSNN
ncbi:MAG: adenosine kinase [Candidatus Midichloriaceae bacterium]|jgi:ribokinase|nr:adenosine kinase [Candidatus Midichloriaceae bacterium]